ncbi:hypothetical protein [Pleomorphomonas oryzae]|uniref:hypothetical protein n=1 Tax=Pleomorphomonas oryzae TaxID=261934 RepID=UPI00041D6A44|nr:hypothetical protein [Pleomorphomonas oryzae]
MTIASEANRSGPYACNGATTHFPFGFRIYDAAHIRVILTDPQGTETTLSLGTDYTVAGVGQSGGGAVDMAVAYASGYRVTLILNVPFTQNIDLENQGAYFAETIERAIDLQTQMSLQLKEQVARAVVLPVTSSVSVDQLTSSVLSLSDIQPQMQALVPIAQDIKTVAGISGSVVAAEGNASTATAAAGVATSKAAEAAASAEAAKIWNPASYSTTAQITTMLGGYVPTGRRLKVGAGLSLNGVAGSDATPAEGDLSADRLLALDLTAVLGRLKNVRFITASGNVQPAPGCTKWLGFLVGGANSGGNSSGASYGAGAPGGAGCMFFATVSDGTQYTAIIGGVGGNSSFAVGATTYSAQGNGGVATNGLINLSGAPCGDGTVTGGNPVVLSTGPNGGNGPFGLGAGGGGARVSNWNGSISKNGIPGCGYGAGGGAAAGLGGSGTGGAGTPGCLLLLEF